MKINLLILLMIFQLASRIFAEQSYEPGVIIIQATNPEAINFVDGKVTIGSSELKSVLEKYPSNSSRKLSFVNDETDGCYRIEFSLDFPLTKIRDALAECPDISYVNLAYYGILCEEPDDTYWDYQWSLEKIQILNAWDISKPNTEILVGILDSGIDYDHEDLIDNIWQNLGEDADNDGHTLEYIGGQWVFDPGDINGIDDDDLDDNPNTYKDDLIGWNFIHDNNNPEDVPGEPDYHGTRIAGLIGGKTYNGIGIAGIAGGWQSLDGIRLIGLRVVEPNFATIPLDAANNAIHFLTKLRQNGFTVIANMSFHFDELNDNNLEPFTSGIAAAREAGVILLSGSGNVQGHPPYNHADVEELPAPARWYGVLAIGASEDGLTLQDEMRSSYSLYDTERGKLLVVAPVDDHVGSGINIYTTYNNDSYINWFHGTSAACPIAVAVVSLMLSINPSLSHSEIAGIFVSTAEKIGNYNYGSSGRTTEVGYGRINAYQALLLALAYDNKSTSSAATVYNTGRRLIHDSNNRYHLVFQSGEEIFYRRSDSGGNNWETPLRLSNGEGDNLFPSITGNSSEQFVIWQRYTGYSNSYHHYDLYFAKNTGPGWSTAKLTNLSDIQFSTETNPLPVSTYEAGDRLLVCAKTSSAIQYVYSDNYGNSWTSAASVPGTSSSHQHPGLSMRPATPATSVLVYDDGSAIYYRNRYTSSWSGAVNVSSGSGTIDNCYPSV